MHTQSLSGQWEFRQADTEAWLPAQVPGGIHTDLLALGHIPDPFVADNELRVQWVAEADWEYRRVFEVAPDLLAEDKLFLVFDGIDTLADISLNGQILGHTQNMFRRYQWEVAPLVKEGENELRLYFPSPVVYIRIRQQEQPLTSPSQSIPGGPYMRKAPCQFGWDWGPMLPPIGIWKDVRLEGRTTARFSDIHLRQHHTNGGAVTVSANLTLERWQEADLKAILRLTAPDGAAQESEATLAGGATAGALEIRVSDPQLWWPNGLGPQPLYDVEVLLYQGAILRDRRTYRIGLRAVALRQEPDAFGSSFNFVVNGMPIFAKGANWIPADSFPTRISDAYLESLISSAADANMNMLRVWGGGFYEEERFYDLCDRYGILVWQDFAFSCSAYPTDEAFFENVRAEAVENLRRLRHRASLALWCGNNEMEIGWVHWGWDKPEHQHLRESYDRMFHQFLPELCAREDPERPYWPSSPSSGTPFQDPNGQAHGDVHYWDVWHGPGLYTDYRQQFPRFVSEFGFQALPSLKTVRTFADESQWNINAYLMDHHQRNWSGSRPIVAQIPPFFRMPRDFPSTIYISQVIQAEAIRCGVEHWRRNKHRVGGALYWQLNDCWPVTSWASLDYFGRWKMLHYAARRFFAPILLSAEEQGTRVALHLTNDLPTDWHGAVRWSLETLTGQTLASGKETASVPALQSVQVCDLDFSAQVTPENRRRVALVYELWQGEERLNMNVLLFAPNKHLELADPGLIVAAHEAGGQIEIEITARQLARFVWLEMENADPVFSDNGFDLPAGRTTKVTLPAMAGWTAARVRDALRVVSLTDSF